jgi:signal transduction histidine kinase
MNGPSRPLHLIILFGILPGAMLVVIVWLYGLLMEGMKTELHGQRALTLRTLPIDGGLTTQKGFAWAVWRNGTNQFQKNSPDWPVAFAPETLQRFEQSLGKMVEHGVEVEQVASGPGILWIIPLENEVRAAYQLRRTFYSRLESLRILIWTAGLILVGGSFVVFATMARKLSDLFNEMESKNLELERANRTLEELGTLKSSFLALVSHELRTPVTRLAGHLQLVKKAGSALPPDIQQRIEEMTIEVGELKRMTNNVLDLTRLQSEDLAARMSLGQIDELVQGAVKRIREPAGQKNLRVEVEAAPTSPVNHDAYLLERILDNLLTNAVKYSSDGGLLAVRLLEEENGVLIQVDNSGPVIPPQERDRIFEKFYRAAQNTDVPGTGLGLYLVRQFILMMGGRVTVEPIEGGNRFILSLPLNSPLNSLSSAEIL